MGVLADRVSARFSPTEWIADDDDALRKAHAEALDEMRRTWMLRALGTGAIGLTLGAVAGMWLCGSFAP